MSPVPEGPCVVADRIAVLSKYRRSSWSSTPLWPTV